jgi:hypothetical protein
LPGSEVRGPVACGDVYRAVRGRPSAIGIIDGYFDQRLAVWHKEILWALAQGVAVFGAASMGALRAAELAEFGMTGVGRVFEWFHDGVLEDDDEVAIVHEPAERGYRALSDAMVNIRATLERAVTEQVIGRQALATLLALAKGMFYPARTFEALGDAAVRHGIATAECEALQRWMDASAGHRIDQKRTDAIVLLERMKDAAATPVDPPRRFHFEYTEAWHELVRRIDREGSAEAAPADPSTMYLLEEVQMKGADYFQRIWQAATERALGLITARAAGTEVQADAVQVAADGFRRRHDLHTPDETHRWITGQRLDLPAFSALMRDEALIAEVRGPLRTTILDQLPQALRAMGELREVADRAERKARLAPGRPLAIAPSGRQALLAEYFEIRLGRAVPPDVAGYARAAGFDDERQFLDAVARELSVGSSP